MAAGIEEPAVRRECISVKLRLICGQSPSAADLRLRSICGTSVTVHAIVEVTRGGRVESQHRFHVAVAHAERGLVAAAGDPTFVSFVRSAIKMFQALPLVEDGAVERFGLVDEEIAVCTASHNAEPFHVAAARSLLRKAGADESQLACGPHPPMHAGSAERLAAAGEMPGRIHNNCSGKHAGMLALAAHHGWAANGYHRIEHPLQQRVLSTLADWCGTAADAIELGIDGCGLPTFALPLDRVAAGCARFAAAAADHLPASAAIVRAMTSHPEYVAGTGRLCTDVMTRTGGRVFAKVGAEGYYCAGAPAARLGVALKVEDGAKRAAEPALLAVLQALDLIAPADLEALAAYARPLVLNTRSETVGEIVARIALSGPSASERRHLLR
jgi:L-asparaginase II